MFKSLLKVLVGKNIKTTLLGVVAGAVIAAGTAVDDRLKDPKAPAITWKNIGIVAAVGALGRVSKDEDK